MVANQKFNHKNIPTTLKLINQWVVWKSILRNGKQSKIPYDAKTKKPARVNDIKTFNNYTLASRVSKYSDFAGIGFVFTDSDNYAGIDIDNCIVDGKLLPEAKAILSELNTYTEVSPSGKGIKAICTVDRLFDGFRYKLTDAVTIECYSNNRYFTITGNVIDGYNDIKPGDGIIERLLSTKATQSVGNKAGSSGKPDNYYERAMEYSNLVEPAIAGTNGHGHTMAFACALIIGFDLSDNEAYAIMRVWNNGCQPPWSEKELQHKITEARKKYSLASNVGYMYSSDEEPTAPKADPNIDLIAISSLISQHEFHSNTDGIPRDLLYVPGLVDKFVTWALSQNPRDNRQLSLLGGLSLMSHLIGRKVIDESGLMSNLYIVGIAPSSGGKQAPLECIKMLFDKTSKADQVIGKVSSDSAIARQLLTHQSTLCLWDEFGLLLQKTNSKHGHMAAVQDMMLELWGATKSKWRARKYADSERDISVVKPCFSFLGMTTPDHFWGGLTRMHLVDGFAGRLLVVDTGKRSDYKDIIYQAPPQSLIGDIEAWLSMSTGNLADVGFGDPLFKVVKADYRAKATFRSIIEIADTQESDDKAAIWGRAIEKAKKLALIYACSRDGFDAVIDVEAARWAKRLVVWATEKFIKQTERITVGEDKFSGLLKQCIMALKEHNGFMQRSLLLKRLSTDTTTFSRVLSTLQSTGTIEVKLVSNKQVVFIV